jgi:hypothetical protein
MAKMLDGACIPISYMPLSRKAKPASSKVKASEQPEPTHNLKQGSADVSLGVKLLLRR